MVVGRCDKVEKFKMDKGRGSLRVISENVNFEPIIRLRPRVNSVSYMYHLIAKEKWGKKWMKKCH